MELMRRYLRGTPVSETIVVPTVPKEVADRLETVLGEAQHSLAVDNNGNVIVTFSNGALDPPTLTALLDAFPSAWTRESSAGLQITLPTARTKWLWWTARYCVYLGVLATASGGVLAHQYGGWKEGLNHAILTATRLAVAYGWA